MDNRIGLVCDFTSDFPGGPDDRINLAEVGATISVHTGPGAICIAKSPA